MIKIGILGDVGSGKSFVAKQFGFPVFDADNEVRKIYRKDKKCYAKLKKAIPEYISTFPINKKEIVTSILSNQKNLKKIIDIVHPIVRLRMGKFIKKNKKNKIKIPLLGSLAKVCTEFNIPDRTKNVPHMLNVKLEIDKIKVHVANKDLFSSTITEWTKAVKHNQGIKEIFSTGSQNQNPPQPNS